MNAGKVIGGTWRGMTFFRGENAIPGKQGDLIAGMVFVELLDSPHSHGETYTVKMAGFHRIDGFLDGSG